MRKIFSNTTMKFVLIILLLMVISAVGGFAFGRNSQHLNDSTVITESPTETAVAPVEQYLPIHATVDKKANFTAIPINEPGEIYDNTITYFRLSEVTIDIDNSTMKLEDAIRDKKISIEELRCYAQLDAKAGVCKEIAESKNGLTRLTYCYPEFDLWSVYDVYETPDGKKHLISDLGLCAPHEDIISTYTERESGKPIDFEDWGLTFDILEASPTGIQMKCVHSGGQQIGDLVVTRYDIWKPTEEKGVEEFISPIAEEFKDEYRPKGSIAKDGAAEITIDFSPYYGKLPAGEYILYLTIEDEYCHEDVHPLMKNFYDRQRFSVPFTIQ